MTSSTLRSTCPKPRHAIAFLLSLIAFTPSLARGDPFPENLVFVELKAQSQASVAFAPGTTTALANEGGGLGVGYRYGMFEIGGNLELAKGFGSSGLRPNELLVGGFAGVLLPLGRVSWLELRLRGGEYIWNNLTDADGASLPSTNGLFLGFEPRVSIPLYRDEYLGVRGFLGASFDVHLDADFAGATTSTPGGLNLGVLLGIEVSLL